MNVNEMIAELYLIIDREELDRAKDFVAFLENILGTQNPELLYINQLINFLDV